MTLGLLLSASVGQIAGRLLLSLLRLIAAIVILRLQGAELFGIYAVLLAVLAVIEWLVDLGQTDIAVREINRTPGMASQILAALLRLRLKQSLCLAPLLPAGLWAAGYGPPMILAGAIAGAGLVPLAVALSARAHLRATFHLGHDLLAELAGAALLLPATAVACLLDAGIAGLMAAYLAGRIAWAGAATVFRRRLPLPSGADAGATAPGGTQPQPAATERRLLQEALPIGLTGLLVSIYDGLAPLLLSYLSDLRQVAIHGVVLRCAMPALLVLQAVSNVFFPLLANAWTRGRADLAPLQHMSFDASLFLAVGFVCVLSGSAEFLMALFDPSMTEHANVLRLMGLLVVVRGMSTAMVPLIIVAGWQVRGAWLTVVSLTAQVLILLFAVPRYGALGAVATGLAVELLTSVGGIAWLAHRATGVRVAWRVPLRILGAGAAACGAVALLPLSTSPAGGILAGGLFLVIVLMLRVADAARVRALSAVLANRHGGGAAAS